MPPEDPDRRRLGVYFALAQVGFEMVVPIAIGYWLDQQLNVEPFLLIVGAILGFAVGIIHVVVLSRSLDDQPPRDKKL
jgi:ATP synthase protein I